MGPDDRETEGFLALLAVRRAARTVDAYRRDLVRLRAFLGKPVAEASLDELGVLRRGTPGRRALRGDDRAAHRIRTNILRPPDADRSAPRQPGGGDRSSTPGAAAAAHPVGERGRATDRRGLGCLPSLAARPCPGRAAVRSGASRLGGGRARSGSGRSGRTVGSGARQGWSRTRSCRSVRGGGRRASPLPRPWTGAPRPSPPPGALPQRQGRRSDARRRVRHHPAPGWRSRARAGTRPPASLAPLVRDPPARRWRRPAQRPGNARTRRPGNDRALHPRLRRATPRALLRSPSARETTELTATSRDPPCGAAPERPSQPPRGALGPARRPRRARRGWRSCRAAPNRFGAPSRPGA